MLLCKIISSKQSIASAVDHLPAVNYLLLLLLLLLVSCLPACLHSLSPSHPPEFRVTPRTRNRIPGATRNFGFQDSVPGNTRKSGFNSHQELRVTGVTWKSAIPESPGNPGSRIWFPQSHWTPCSGVTRNSGFPDSFNGITLDSKFRRHRNSGFPDSTGTAGFRINTELRDFEVTRNSRFE